MTNDELNAIRTLFREEANSIEQRLEQRLRGVIREEVNAAVYASEQRMGERIDGLKADVDEVKAIQKQMQADLFETKLNYVEVKADLRQAIAILDEVTLHIKDIRERQAMLEAKFEMFEARFGMLEIRVEQLDKKYEEHFHHIWLEIQSLAGGIKDFTKEFATIARLLNGRIADHEKLPFDQAHRHPGSAA